MTLAVLTQQTQPLAGRAVAVGDYGARGDGQSDDRAAIQRALDSRAGMVLVPPGVYLLGGPLRLPSGCHFKAHPQAHFVLADEAGVDSEVFLLTNSDPVNGNRDIVVEGGIWDGNNRRNVRGPNCPGAYTGAAVNFHHVNGLEFRAARLRNAETYFIRGARLTRFRFCNLEFWTDRPRPNQDGVHIAGHSHHGTITGLRGLGARATADDLVALVADDALERAQNLGLCNGPISNIRIDGLEAEDCHSFVRLASVSHPIEEVEVDNVRGGCEACAVNMDALRYCAVPLFADGDGQFPEGAGSLRRIRLRDFHVHRSRGCLANPLLLLETRVSDFRIERFRRDLAKDASPQIPTLRAALIGSGRLRLSGVARAAAEASARTHGRTTIEELPPGVFPPGSVRITSLLDMDTPFVFHGDAFDRLDVD